MTSLDGTMSRYGKFYMILTLLFLHIVSVACYGKRNINSGAIPREKEEVKIFGDDEVPPEETLELWMSGQGQGQGQGSAPSPTSDVMNDMYCLLNASLAMNSAPSSVNHLCSGNSGCTNSKTNQWLLTLCLREGCGRTCHTARHWSDCVASCGMAHQRTRRSSRSPRKPHVMPMLPPSRNELRAAMSKRYRLSLYDCIASYCGGLSGTSRKSCIVYHCHRLRA